MATKKPKGINPELEKAISDMLKQVMIDPECSLTDKMKVVDRSLKLEAIKLKMNSDDWGTGLFGGEEQEDE